MPFLGFLQILKYNISQKKNKPSLRGLHPVPFCFIKTEVYCKYSLKRVSSFVSCTVKKASMTLEAAFVMPLFLFACLSLISAMNVMKIKSCMDVAVAEAGNAIALESYGEYVGSSLKPLYIRQKIDTFLDKNLQKGDREKLSDSILVTDASFLEDNIVSFRVDYKVTPDFGLLGLSSVKLHATYYGHNWLGYEAKKETETMVYISKEASVYHLDKNCTYLNLTINEVSYSSLKNYRNNSREKYKECSFCDGIINAGVVYITPEGNSYHNIKTCIGLTRSIYTVPLSTVSHKKVCTRCGESK